MNDNFNFLLLSEIEGYVSARDKTNIKPNVLVRGSQNVYKKNSGTIASRPGLLRRGAPDNTNAGVVSDFVWNTSLGKINPLRVENNKLQVESDIVSPGTYVWYDLLITSTLLNPAATLTRLIFDPWYSTAETKDRLLFCRGDDNIFHWSGGITQVASGTANTLTKLNSNTTWEQDGFAFNSSGEKVLIINGVEYTYTGGENTQILTGVSPSAASVVSGQVAIQSVLVKATTPATGFKADFLRTIGNQVYVGSYTSRLVYVSQQDDFTNFVVPTPAEAGDPELLTLDNAPTGIGIKNGNAAISAGTQDWYLITFSIQTIGTAAAPLSVRQTNVDKKVAPRLSAALAHEFIDSNGDNLVYLDQDHQLRSFGTFKDIFGEQKYPSLSQDIQDELRQTDFTGGHLIIIGDFLYLTAPNSGVDYMLQSRESVDQNGLVQTQRFWHPPQVRNVSRFCLINGITFGHSNANPQIYQIWDTEQWSDDSPSGDALPYNCVMTLPYRQMAVKAGAERFILQTFDKLAVEGYISDGVDLNGNIYIEYQGSAGLQNPNINSIISPTKFFTGQNIASLGGDSLGDNPLGIPLSAEETSQDALAKFRSIPGLTPVHCFEYAIELYTTDPNSRWEILSIGVNAAESDQKPSFVRK